MKPVDEGLPEGFGEMPAGFDLGRALAEADRCLLCFDAPCSAGCPAATDPGTFMRKLRLRNVTGAIRTIKHNNALGGACGVLCPTHRLCEERCAASGIDRPIAIGKVQRALVEHAWRRGLRPLRAGPATGKRVAVVGSGPAGLSCAAELAQAGVAVTVFEARAEPGGVIRYGVPAYRFSRRFLERELAEIEALGVELRCNTPIRGAGALRALREEQGFDAVFLAPGLWKAARLSTDDRPAGVLGSVGFLAALREGRYEQLAAQLRAKRVAVIGGGSVAVDCAESAVKLGARDVYLVYRRSFLQMPAEPDERQAVQEQGVHLVLLNQPVGYVSDEGVLSAVELVRTELGAPDDSGRRRPEPIAGSEWQLAADVVIEAIGNVPAEDSPDWFAVDVDSAQLVKTDDRGRTSVDGVYAGGDIVRGPSLVVKAVHDGKVAARAILEQLGVVSRGEEG